MVLNQTKQATESERVLLTYHFSQIDWCVSALSSALVTENSYHWHTAGVTASYFTT